MNSPAGDLPLSGVRVADFTHVIAGPFATQLLGDLGAEIIKIEEVARGDVGRSMAPYVKGQSHYHLAFNRNKRSIAIDIKDPDGLRAAREIVAGCDVLVENFTPGALARAGLGYADVARFNPGIVYCSISGFGVHGPLSTKGYYDLIGQAYAGVMSTNGDPDGPPMKVGIPVGDTSGSLFSVIGILAALYHRKETGQGRHLELSLYDCLLSILANYGGYYLATGEQPRRTGSKHYYSVPYGLFDTSDGSVVVGVFTDVQWQSFCRAVELEKLGADPDLATSAGRVRHRTAVEDAVARRLAAMTAADLVARLDAVGIPCGPVQDIHDALAHPQAQLRSMVRTTTHPAYGDVRVISHPFGDFARTEMAPPPLHGEHGREILLECGLAGKDVDDLLRRGVVRNHPDSMSHPVHGEQK